MAQTQAGPPRTSPRSSAHLARILERSVEGTDVVRPGAVAHGRWGRTRGAHGCPRTCQGGRQSFRGGRLESRPGDLRHGCASPLDVGEANLGLGLGSRRCRCPALDWDETDLARSVDMERHTLRGVRQPIPRLPCCDGCALQPRRMVPWVSSHCRRVVRDHLRAVAHRIGLARVGRHVGLRRPHPRRGGSNIRGLVVQPCSARHPGAAHSSSAWCLIR